MNERRVAEQEELREKLEEQLAMVKRMQSLLVHEGWKALTIHLKAAVMTRHQIDFSKELQSLDDAFRSASMRAEANGIRTVLGYPQTLIDEAEIDLAQIKERLQELEHE